MVSQLTSNLHTSHQRRIVGATNPLDADAGSVRGQYAVSVGRNLIHASDAFESATKEIGLWFAPEELSEYEPIAWVRGFSHRLQVGVWEMLILILCFSALGHGGQLERFYSSLSVSGKDLRNSVLD